MAYVLMFLYITTRWLLRASIMMFLLRQFPIPSARQVIIGTLVVMSISSLMVTFMAIFACKPISYFWTRWDGEQ
jgi:hypothetical protein